MSEDKVYTYKEIQQFVEDDALRLPIKMKLIKPFAFGEEEITYITIEREPLAGDIGCLPISGQLVGDTYSVLSKITGLELPKIKKLRIKDYKNLQSIFQYFLEGSDDEET